MLVLQTKDATLKPHVEEPGRRRLGEPRNEIYFAWQARHAAEGAVRQAFVTGATGFLGGGLVRRLTSEGIGVKALVRPGSDTANLERHGAYVVRGSLMDEQAVAALMRGCEVTYHLAGLTSRTSPTRGDCLRANVDVTERVANAALTAGVKRFVHCSSAVVYGVIDKPPVDEASPTRSDSPYAESKVMGEEAIRRAHRLNGLPAIIARFPGVLGYGSVSWIGLLRAIGKGGFRLIGSGRNRTHTVHVSDLLEGLTLCGTVPGIEGRTYNLASDHPVTVSDLVNTIAAELGVTLSGMRLPALPYAMLHRLNGLTYRSTGRELPRANTYELFLSDKVMDIARARRDLGYAPTFTLAAGLRDTIRRHVELGEL